MAEERQLGEMTFMTVAEVAAVMRVSKMTVYRLVHSGELPAVRTGSAGQLPPGPGAVAPGVRPGVERA